MKLKELKELIYSDLNIIDHSTGITYKQVWKYSVIFETLSEKEVIGIRAVDNYIVVSIR